MRFSVIQVYAESTFSSSVVPMAILSNWFSSLEFHRTPAPFASGSRIADENTATVIASAAAMIRSNAAFTIFVTGLSLRLGPAIKFFAKRATDENAV